MVDNALRSPKKKSNKGGSEQATRLAEQPRTFAMTGFYLLDFA